MNAAAVQPGPIIELYDVTPETAELLAAFFRVAQANNGPEPFVFPASRDGVSWQTYESFLIATDGRLLRHSFADGTLELMSPRELERENTKAVLRRLIQSLMLATKQPVVTLGTTTLASLSKCLGIEPDEAFCFARRVAMESRPYLDVDCTELPHLVIEVSRLQQADSGARVSAVDVDRLDLLARLGVREIWFVDEGFVEILHNRGGRLIAGGYSQFFDSVTGSMLTRHLRSRFRIGENACITEFLRDALKT